MPFLRSTQYHVNTQALTQQTPVTPTSLDGWPMGANGWGSNQSIPSRPSAPPAPAVVEPVPTTTLADDPDSLARAVGTLLGWQFLRILESPNGQSIALYDTAHFGTRHNLVTLDSDALARLADLIQPLSHNRAVVVDETSNYPAMPVMPYTIGQDMPDVLYFFGEERDEDSPSRF